jgi:AraC family L-rhamnose operon transcriptional activator RhaR/AraC family L-rhamnose operon regulatory protein RhaS
MGVTPAISLMATAHSPAIRSWGVSAERFSRYRSSESTPHNHDVVEFFFVLAGRGLHCTGTHTHELKPGDMGIVTLGQSHCIVTPGEPMDILNIYLDPTRFQRAGLSRSVREFLDRLLRPADDSSSPLNESHAWSIDRESPIHTLMASIDREATQRRPGFEEAIEMYVRLLLLEFARLCLPAAALGGSEEATLHPSVQRVRAYLEENWTESIDLDRLAERARITKSHLCRVFRREVGNTIIGHVHQLRVQHAMRLLAQGEAKIISIAHEVGFGDLANFNRVFRRLAGMTPTEFRRVSQSPSRSLIACRTDPQKNPIIKVIP